MLYWLIDLSDKITVLNVFRYITFRTGGRCRAKASRSAPMARNPTSSPRPARRRWAA